MASQVIAWLSTLAIVTGKKVLSVSASLSGAFIAT